jgi:tRNA modification GTPase
VTDIKGTTRDWVSARCKIGPLSIELIDTAGLDEQLEAAPEDVVEKASQRKTAQILEDADLVLLVLDNSRAKAQLNDKLVEAIAGKRVLTVLNKSDLPAKLDTGKLPKILANTVQISAKFETGIKNLTRKIRQLAGVADYDLHAAVCFTARQENLLKQLKNAEYKQQATSIITELLNGELRV